MTLLRLEGVSTGYGKVKVLWEIDLELAAGEIMLLLGANGAGKSTILRVVAGLAPCWSGRIELDGEPIQSLAPAQRMRRSIAYMSETGVFSQLTVAENLRLGGYFLGRAQARRRAEDLYTLFPDLAERRAGRPASGGQRKMLAMAKALVAEPRLVLMDEPSAGLAPTFVKQVIDTLRVARTGGSALLIAEQNDAFLELGDRGALIAGGLLEKNDEIKAAYFGLGVS